MLTKSKVIGVKYWLGFEMGFSLIIGSNRCFVLSDKNVIFLIAVKMVVNNLNLAGNIRRRQS